MPVWPALVAVAALALLSAHLLGVSAAQTTPRSDSAGAEIPRRGGTLIYGRGGDSVNLDPAHAIDGESLKIADNVFDTLVRYRLGTTELEPALATSWEVSKDGLAYTFHLRRGVTFHDGTPFDADAVIFSLARQLDPRHPFHKVGGRYLYWDAMRMADIVERLEALDPYRVRITLKQPEAPFLANLGMNFAAIVSPAAARRYGETFSSHPVGTGPFIFERWRKDDRIELRANPSYWEGRPYLDRLIFRSIPDNSVRYLELRGGAIHIMEFPNPDDLPLIERDRSLQLLSQPGMNVGYLALNTRRPPFDNPLVRRAVNHAINKEALVQVVFGGRAQPAVNPLPPVIWGYHDGIAAYAYDPARARRLLAEAGLPNGFPAALWAMTVPRPYMPDGLKAAEAIRADLSQVGVTARIVTYEWGTYLAKTRNGEHDMALLGWTGDNGDPDNFLAVLFEATSNANIAFYQNAELQDLLQRAKRSTAQTVREGLYRRAQEIIHGDAPWVPLAHAVQVLPMRRNVQGFVLEPTGKRRLHRTWLR